MRVGSFPLWLALLLAVLLCVLLWPLAAAAETLPSEPPVVAIYCKPYAVLAAEQGMILDQRIVWQGLARNGSAIVEVWQSDQGGWAIVARVPSGRACIIDQGGDGSIVLGYPVVIGDGDDVAHAARLASAQAFLIGQLTAQVSGLNQRLDQLFPMLTKLDQVSDETVRRLDMVEAEIEYMKPGVKSWSRCKNRLAGIVIALPLAGGSIGVALDRVGGWILKLIGDQ